jgi:HK97 family phage portal protein
MIFRKAQDRESVLAHTMGPAGTRFNIRTDMAEDAELVKRYGLWMYRCINICSSVAASIPLRLFAVDTGGTVEKYWHGRKPDSRTKAMLRGNLKWKPGNVAVKRMQGDMDNLVEVHNHPILELLDNVNPWQEGYSYRDLMYKDLDVFGRHFTHLVGPKGGQPTELWRMQPDLTSVVKSASDFIQGFDYGNGTNPARYEPEEVVWIRIPDPADPWKDRGPMAAGLDKIDASIFIAKYQKWMFERGGSPDWVMITKKGLSQQQRRDLNKSWRAKFARLWNRARSLMILEGDADLKALSQSPRELEYNQSDTQARDTVCGMFGVPVAFVQSDRVAANSREAMNQFKLLTIWPKVTRVEDKLNQQLVPLWSDRLFLMHDNPIEEDRVIRIKERQSQLGAGGTINEARAMDGLEALDDEAADTPLVASGLVRLDSIGLGTLDALAESVEAEEVEDITGDVQTTPEQVLTGGQITAASAIIASVVNGSLPIESARGQLVVMFNLTPEQADAMLAGVENFESSKPDPVVPPTPDEPDGELPENDSKNAGCRHGHNWGDVDTKALDPYKDEDFENALGATLRRLTASLASAIQDTKSVKEPATLDADALMDVAGWPGELADVASRHIAIAVEAAGSAAISQVVSGIAFDLENQRVERYIQTASRQVGGQAAETWGKQIRAQLVAGIAEGESTRQLAARIRQYALEQSAYNAERIARTERAFASTAGQIEGWAQSGVVTGKEYILSPDACPICVAVDAAYKDITIDLDRPMYQVGDSITYKSDSGEDAVYNVDYAQLDGPPIHPNCRCTLVPVITGDNG